MGTILQTLGLICRISMTCPLLIHYTVTMTRHHISHILLTRSEKGMSLMTPTHKHDVPTHAKDVVDVTGAGDTVVAAIAFGLGITNDPLTLVAFANQAAGVVVSKIGTATVTLDELHSHDS